jgi:hypothetical protein
MEDTRPEEKRAIRRFTLQLPVTVTAKSGERVEATAESRDVSSHGICFYCDTALEPELSIDFTLTLPTEVTMTEPLQVRCSGRVVRVEKSGGSGKFAVAAAIDNYEFVADNEMQNQVVDAEADATPAV